MKELLEEGSQEILFKIEGNTKERFHSRLNDANIQTITLGMEDLNNYLVYINFSYNNLSELSIQALSKILKDAINLKTLIFKGCNISDSSCIELAKSLTVSTELT